MSSKNDRKFFSNIFSSISIRHYFYILSLAFFALAFTSFASLNYAQMLFDMSIENASQEEITFFKEYMSHLKFAIPSMFVLSGVIIIFTLETIMNHFKGQIIPLNIQLDSYLNGNIDLKRPMRDRDEFKPVMEKIHKLASIIKK